jgi:hypothetical protein
MPSSVKGHRVGYVPASSLGGGSGSSGAPLIRFGGNDLELNNVGPGNYQAVDAIESYYRINLNTRIFNRTDLDALLQIPFHLSSSALFNADGSFNDFVFKARRVTNMVDMTFHILKFTMQSGWSNDANIQQGTWIGQLYVPAMADGQSVIARISDAHADSNITQVNGNNITVSKTDLFAMVIENMTVPDAAPHFESWEIMAI